MEQLLSTKLYIPPSRPKLVTRPRLIRQLNEALSSGRTPGVTLISAPAGFGKTTLLSTWIYDLRLVTPALAPGASVDDLQAKTLSQKKITNPKSKIQNRKSEIVNRVAWLSLDEGDNDPARFLAYLLSALKTIGANIEDGLLASLLSPQPPPIQPILTSLLNEIITFPTDFILVLDDYHVIDSKAVDKALTFLFEHQPPQMHLVIATREDPSLPLARLRAHGHLTELRAADLRFTLSEATEFFNQVMSLKLSAENIAALETRTEGWIAGLQLAALSMQGQKDTASFIKSFTGSHHFVMDYLVEEVLQQQPENIQTFLLRTSILDRLCGPLCDAVLVDTSLSGQDTLEQLERANLFIIPLDNERRWYRYHHLFGDLLRQRLYKSMSSSTGNSEYRVNELHIRASQWYEDNNLALEAFHHAAAANDIERAERIIDGRGIPLHFSGGVVPIIDWLASLPVTVKNARPSLWWRHAAMLLINGQTAGVAENLQAAEAAIAANLQGTEPDDDTRNLMGLIAGAKATLALTRYDVETMLVQSHRALEFLYPGSLFMRANANWTLGYAYILQGNRAAARQAFMESISLSQASKAVFTAILATIGLGLVQELDNELYQAVETYQRVLQWAGDKPQQIIGEAHLGLARVFYEWNELESAEQHAEQSLQLARQYESFIDRFVIAQVFLVRLKLAQGDVTGAAAVLAEADQSVRQYNFVHRMPEVAAVQVLTLLRQGNLTAAARVAEAYQLPLGQARVHLARGDASAALKVLELFRQQVEAKNWKDEQLKAMVLEAVALHEHVETDEALHVINDALAFAEPGGFIRIFIDEGAPMAQLLSEAAAQGVMPGYISKLLAAFESEKQSQPQPTPMKSLVEPLSQRELEVLQLIAQGLSNDEIGKRLFLALDTVKGHNRRIYDKLQVQRRTEAVARARELGLL